MAVFLGCSSISGSFMDCRAFITKLRIEHSAIHLTFTVAMVTKMTTKIG